MLKLCSPEFDHNGIIADYPMFKVDPENFFF
jgi:hypothetical protein